MRCRNTFILSYGLLLASTAATAQYTGFNPRELTRLKAWVKSDREVKGFYDSLLQAADAALQDEPNPIDTIRTEGLLKGDPRKIATWTSLADLQKMYALALAYRLKGDSYYLDKAEVYLYAWATTNSSRGDPIDDTNLDPAIEAYDMLKKKLTPGEDSIISRWLRRTAAAELNAPYNRHGRATSYNNWHSHRLKIVGEIAFTIGDTALQGYTVRELKVQIARNLNPDGSSADFVTRDALHYHLYDLEPLLRLAIVLRRATGVDYYSYTDTSGASIKKSVDWLLPWLDGRKTHAEFVNSTVEFDRKRAQNGETSYKAGTLFEPKNGVATLLLAVYFDEGMLGLARRLLGTADRYPAWQAVVDALGH